MATSAWSCIWSMTRSTPASSSARSRATASSTVPITQAGAISRRKRPSGRTCPRRSVAARQPLAHLGAVRPDHAAGHEREHQRPGVAPGRLPGGGHGDPPAAARLGIGEDGVVLVGPPGGDLHAAAPAAAAHDEVRVGPGDGLGHGVELVDAVVAAGEGERARRPGAVHDLDLLLEHLQPRLGVGEREPVRRVLALVPAGAHPDLHPPARHVVHRRGRLGQHRRVAERRRRHQRAQAQPGRGPRHGRQRGPGVERRPLRPVLHGPVVVGSEQGVEAGVLAGPGQPLIPAHALLALDHQAHAHAADPRTAPVRACE